MPAPVDSNTSENQAFFCKERDAASDGGHLLHAPGAADGATASTSAPGLGDGLSSWWW